MLLLPAALPCLSLHLTFFLPQLQVYLLVNHISIIVLQFPQAGTYAHRRHLVSGVQGT